MPHGQAELDLPDPLERNSPAGAGAGSAPSSEDDLIAQLAGDEIDRLLADADTPRNNDEGNVKPALHRSAGTPQTDSSPAPDAAQEPQDVEAELNAQLDDLFKKIDKPVEPSADAITASVGPGPRAAAGSPNVVEGANHSALDALGSMPSDRGGTTSATTDDVTTAGPDALELKMRELPAVRGSALGSILLKPLELLNSPLAGVSDSTRATIGKLALLTLFNAVAVIIYVLFFRAR